MSSDLLVSDFAYDLPQGLIAQQAMQPRDAAKLLLVGDDSLVDHVVADLPLLLNERWVLFCNDTKVVRARIDLCGARVLRADGREVVLNAGEVFFLRLLASHRFAALVRPGRKLQPGAKVMLPDSDVCLQIVGMTDVGREILCSCAVEDLLADHGRLPLPPYISYEEGKESSYQTMFAREEGSVAAPTASLHFTPAVLSGLADIGVAQEYVTLHVGLGTFQPLQEDAVSANTLHSERVVVDIELFSRIASYKQSAKKILPVGTTVCRTLESLPYVWRALRAQGYDCTVFGVETCHFWDGLVSRLSTTVFVHDLVIVATELRFATTLFIYPGYDLCVIDGLFTNFHLPKSSLLLLVATVLGSRDRLLEAYDYAIASAYRFYSFGDAMLYLRPAGP